MKGARQPQAVCQETKMSLIDFAFAYKRGTYQLESTTPDELLIMAQVAASRFF
jgi:hypothetical protein